MIVCPNCRSENPDGAAFCAKCGTKLSATSPGENKPIGAPQPVRGDVKRNGVAIAALVLGIVGLVLWFWSPGTFRFGIIGTRLIIIPVFAFAGLVLGILGLKSQKRGIAVAGICICGIGIIVPVVYFIIAIIFWAQV